MKVCKAHAPNLETLKRAFHQGDAALVEARRASDGVVVALLCAIRREGDTYVVAPFAEMVNGNPYDLYEAPNPEGAYFPITKETVT